MISGTLAVYGLPCKPHVARGLFGQVSLMRPLKTIFAERLSQELTDRQLSGNALAKVSGVGQRSVARILVGKQDPTLGMVDDICRALGLQAVQMLTANKRIKGASNVRVLTSPYPPIFKDHPQQGEKSRRVKRRRE